MVMEAMKLHDRLPIHGKRLHTKMVSEKLTRLLSHEIDVLMELRHSNILLLMAICEVGVKKRYYVLLFERVWMGSLYSLLHEKNSFVVRMNVILTNIIDALMYLEERGVAHCALSSHAVQLCTPDLAKLCNFEYARKIDGHRGEGDSRTSQHVDEAFTPWLAPEIMDMQDPAKETDKYSFGVLIWEVHEVDIPWRNKSRNEILRYLSVGTTLPLHGLPQFHNVLKLLWDIDPVERDISLEEIKRIINKCDNKVAEHHKTPVPQYTPRTKSFQHSLDSSQQITSETLTEYLTSQRNSANIADAGATGDIGAMNRNDNHSAITSSSKTAKPSSFEYIRSATKREFFATPSTASTLSRAAPVTARNTLERSFLNDTVICVGDRCLSPGSLTKPAGHLTTYESMATLVSPIELAKSPTERYSNYTTPRIMGTGNRDSWMKYTAIADELPTMKLFTPTAQSSMLELVSASRDRVVPPLDFDFTSRCSTLSAAETAFLTARTSSTRTATTIYSLAQ